MRRPSIRPLVVAVLREHPDTRRNNNALVLETWRKAGYPVSDELLALAGELPQVESIRRQRARIQNEQGQFRP